METPVLVVEYLGDSVSKQLLCKFPDDSSLDFDYSQSSIWSPLVKPQHLLSPLSSEIRRKLAECHQDGEADKGLLEQVAVNLKKKIATTVMLMKQRNKNRKKKKKQQQLESDFSPAFVKASSSMHTPRKKGWTKILKVATKNLKKETKKRGPTAHIKLSNCLMMDANS